MTYLDELPANFRDCLLRWKEVLYNHGEVKLERTGLIASRKKLESKLPGEGGSSHIKVNQGEGNLFINESAG